MLDELLQTNEAKTKFSEHINIENNKRILFSAKFGDGKTTFLKEFFKNNDQFDVIHLFPINYSVASNEDIYELVKFDIFYDLLRKDNINIKEKEIIFSQFAAKYAKGNKLKIIKLFSPFLKAIPLLGDVLSDSADKIIDQIDDFINQYKTEGKNDKEIIEEYLLEHTQRRGSIHENNFYTKFISELLKQLSTEKRKTVLIIDDLDRIDPEHIFRILNVFAAQQDIYSDTNKFGFDKIIVVCDVDNLRSIFHHKFGIETDFNGYIDKFYSNEVFNYSFKEQLIEILPKLVSSLQGNHEFNNQLTYRSGALLSEITWLLSCFLNTNILNVRNVVKLNKSQINIPKYTVFEKLTNNSFLGLLIFNILKSVFGNYNEVLIAFEKLKVTELKKHEIQHKFKIEYLFEEILFPVDYVFYIKTFNSQRAQLKLPSYIKNEFKKENDPILITGRIIMNLPYSTFILEENETEQKIAKYVQVDLFEYYYQVYKKCYENGFLK